MPVNVETIGRYEELEINLEFPSYRKYFVNRRYFGILAYMTRSLLPYYLLLKIKSYS